MIYSVTPLTAKQVVLGPVQVLFFIASAKTLAWQAFQLSRFLFLIVLETKFIFFQVETIRIAGQLNNDLHE